MEPITVETYVERPIEKVWKDFTDPEAVVAWNNASGDWHTPRALNDVRTGGGFSYRMEAKDGSAGFDFDGTYTSVIDGEYIAYEMSDGRKVEVRFVRDDGGVRVIETFDPEHENTPDMQREGWQSILDNFKKYSEAE
jgi:uncharacterized protein YndB with AHSA1/START domain